MRAVKAIFYSVVFMILSANVFSQPYNQAKLGEMTREEILQLSQDDLLEMSMEDLLFLSQKMGISIDELLNMKTTIASKTTLTPRETPGIVSFITEEEIKNSGARDLIDVLRLVPGFDFGYDVQSVIGVGLRGNWVHEGKILMLIDGQPMNELRYYNIPFGNHIPVDQIKRIEIIRGPGSAIYGGNAELGVINIITRSGKDIQGVEISGTYGQMQKSMGRSNMNVNMGSMIKNWDFTAKGFIGEAYRSDQIFTEYIDSLENKIDLSKGGSGIKTRQFNLGASNENLSVRLVYDDYKSRYFYYDYDYLMNIGSFNEFRSLLGEIKYNIKVNDKLNLTPKLNYKYSRPYFEAGYVSNININRYTGAMLLNYQAGKKTTFVAGIEYLIDKGYCIEDSGSFYSTNTRSININNTSVFAEGTFKVNKINIVTGLRTEHNSNYGWAFAPRVGATGVFNKFHFKTLLSSAFRSPAIGNIDASSKIEPEKSFVSEIEVGYRINDNMFVTANVFDIRIKKNIVYFDTGAGVVPIIDWGYINANNSGSDGFELEFKAKYAKGYAAINYSFYTQAFQSLPVSYIVPGHENSALGLSQHKIGFYASYQPVENLSIGPSMTLIGKKYGYSHLDEEGNPAISSFGPYCLFNLSITYNNLLLRGLSINLSAFDILNQKPPFVHPYEGSYCSFPGRSREILLKVTLNTDIFKQR
jgi:outer membrane receptor for ferrienterochelin and colicin